jgi:hypothetical protein
VCRPINDIDRSRIDDIDRWRKDWDRAARDFDPGFKRRKRARQDEAARRSNELLRRLVEEAERARREDDPTVN